MTDDKYFQEDYQDDDNISALKMVAVRSSKVFSKSQNTTQHNNPEDHHLYSLFHKNLKSYKIIICFYILTTYTKDCGAVVSTPASYSQGTSFQSHMEDHMTQVSVAFFSASVQILGHHPKTVHDYILPHLHLLH
jgi:hypothetical protein